MTIERILVGLDGGDLADHAVEAAAALVKAFGAQVEFLHAVASDWSRWAGVASQLEAIEAQVTRDARTAQTHRLRSVVGEGGVLSEPLGEHLTVLPGKAARVLLDRAQSFSADLLMLGSHRRRGLFDFGGTARAVLARTSCPVWVQTETVRPIHRILVPIESPETSNETLATARTLAGGLDASLTVAHLFVPPEFAYEPSRRHVEGFPTYVVDDLREKERAEFEAFVEGLDGKDVQAVFREGRPGPGILDLQDQADLIVMGTHGRSRLAREVLGSVAYQVIREASLPVVAVPLPPHLFLPAGEEAEPAEASDPQAS